jgi:hypothetical protein
MYGFPRTSVTPPRRVGYDLTRMSGCVFWLRADQGVSYNSSNQIAAVRDLGPYNLSVATSGTLLLSANAVGTMPAMDTNGGNNYLTINHSDKITFGTGDFTIISVAAWTNTALGMLYGKFNADFPYIGPNIFAYGSARGVTQYRTQASYSVYSSADDNDGGCRIRIFARSGTTIYAWHGTTLLGTTTGASDNFNDTNVAYILGRPGIQQVTGKLAEFAQWNRFLSDAERLDVTTLLSRKYGL